MAKQKKITEPMQQVAVDFLEELVILQMNNKINDEEITKLMKKMEDKYCVEQDPFTLFPCTTKEYLKSNYEYNRQLFENRYGYYDD